MRIRRPATALVAATLIAVSFLAAEPAFAHASTSISTPAQSLATATHNGVAASLASDEYRGYKLQALSSGLLLDVEGGSESPGARIVQWYENGSASQHWAFFNSNIGTTRIVNMNSGLCLYTDGVTGHWLTQQTCNSLSGEVWQTNADGNIWSYFYQRNIDVKDNSYAAGALIDTWYVNKSTNQQFYQIAA
jgi:hypothetical protein